MISNFLQNFFGSSNNNNVENDSIVIPHSQEIPKPIEENANKIFFDNEKYCQFISYFDKEQIKNCNTESFILRKNHFNDDIDIYDSNIPFVYLSNLKAYYCYNDNHETLYNLNFDSEIDPFYLLNLSDLNKFYNDIVYENSIFKNYSINDKSFYAMEHARLLTRVMMLKDQANIGFLHRSDIIVHINNAHFPCNCLKNTNNFLIKTQQYKKEVFKDINHTLANHYNYDLTKKNISSLHPSISYISKHKYMGGNTYDWNLLSTINNSNNYKFPLFCIFNKNPDINDYSVFYVKNSFNKLCKLDVHYFNNFMKSMSFIKRNGLSMLNHLNIKNLYVLEDHNNQNNGDHNIYYYIFEIGNMFMLFTTHFTSLNTTYNIIQNRKYSFNDNGVFDLKILDEFYHPEILFINRMQLSSDKRDMWKNVFLVFNKLMPKIIVNSTSFVIKQFIFLDNCENLNYLTTLNESFVKVIQNFKYDLHQFIDSFDVVNLGSLFKLFKSDENDECVYKCKKLLLEFKILVEGLIYPILNKIKLISNLEKQHHTSIIFLDSNSLNNLNNNLYNFIIFVNDLFIEFDKFRSNKIVVENFETLEMANRICNSEEFKDISQYIQKFYNFIKYTKNYMNLNLDYDSIFNITSQQITEFGYLKIILNEISKLVSRSEYLFNFMQYSTNLNKHLNKYTNLQNHSFIIPDCYEKNVKLIFNCSYFFYIDKINQCLTKQEKIPIHFFNDCYDLDKIITLFTTALIYLNTYYSGIKNVKIDVNYMDNFLNFFSVGEGPNLEYINLSNFDVNEFDYAISKMDSFMNHFNNEEAFYNLPNSIYSGNDMHFNIEFNPRNEIKFLQ